MAIKKVEVEERVCDVCGKLATGDFYFTANCNGEVYFESKLAVDLCPKCAMKYAVLFTENLSNLFPERYDDVTEEDKKKIMEAIKETKLSEYYEKYYEK